METRGRAHPQVQTELCINHCALRWRVQAQRALPTGSSKSREGISENLIIAGKYVQGEVQKHKKTGTKFSPEKGNYREISLEDVVFQLRLKNAVGFHLGKRDTVEGSGVRFQGTRTT